MEQHRGMNRLNKSGFSRHLQRLAPHLRALMAVLGQVFKDSSMQMRYVIDSFPVAVCHNTRTGQTHEGQARSCRRYFV